VDKEIKKFDLIPLYPSKTSWNFNKKKKCDNIIKEWHLDSKLSNLKKKNFLELLSNNFSEIKLLYKNRGPWLENFGFSNLLYA